MSILTSFTIRCLKKNRVRTLVTLIGIILSVSLFTAVAEGAWSGRQYLANVAIADVGAYHGMYDEISDAELAELRTQDEVENTATLDGVGWALVGKTDQFYPYLRISSMSENFTDLVSVRLLEGRMPQNSRELLISNRAAACTRTDLAVGQTLKLSAGQRETLDGSHLGEHNSYLFEEEHLVGTTEDVWTIVGVYDRFPYDIEGSELPGSLALTVGELSTDHKAFFTLDQINDTLDFLAAHNYGSVSSENKDLLLYSGVSGNGRLEQVISGLVTILFGLIFLGSVALIYNSFSISVSERTKQFGLLKSIGSTNRQIRRTVLTEAILLCVVGIPLGLLVGCGGIGLTLRFLRPAFDSIVQLDGAKGIPIKLVLHAPSLLLAAGIGLFTALVSAWIPARRATRLSPITAIRQSTDVKVRSREVRVSPLTGKLFGFPGTLAAKNFKRSRKQYRSTVVSLFMSIVLFVSAFCFADYLRRDIGDTVSKSEADLVVSDLNFKAGDSTEHLAALADQLLSAEHVEEAAFTVCTSQEFLSPEAAMTPEAVESMLHRENGSFCLSGMLCFLPEADYSALCAQAGVNPETRQAVAYATQLLFIYSDSGTAYQPCPLFRSSALPLTLTMELLLPREHMIVNGSVYDDEDHLTGYYFISEDDVDEYGNYNTDDLVYVPLEEATARKELVIGGMLEKRPLVSAENTLTIYLPLTGTEALQKDIHSQEALLFLRAPEHLTAKAEVEGILSELALNDEYTVNDTRDGRESLQAALLVLNVFTFGFIILISLIAAANVFNTISTNVALRRREFATLKSVGMGDKSFGRMMRFECLLYGSKALLWGLPVSIGISWLIWKAVTNAFITSYRLPWTAMAIAAGSVFLVVFATMLYATGKIRKDNPIDALKQETM
ncbi:MAG: FtsX-like permease family protein [Oscillospiraceae bacterium]|nr:FtsX-like permease family protein [Oscillospiraceae bacterium]